MSGARDIRVVSLDAGGTLIEPVEPVGETYARLARAAGFAADADALEAGFRRAFAAAPPLAAPAGTPDERLAFERSWWRAIVDASLDHALGRLAATAEGTARPAHAPDAAERRARDGFFAATFAHYARGEAWRVFPDVPRALDALRRLGCTLVVVSNFDARLDGVLAALGLRTSFHAVVPSSEAGAAKPDRRIFHRALALAGDPPAERCLHVGDSLAEDVAGARAAGLAAAWLDRHGGSPSHGAGVAGDAPGAPGVPRIASLEALPALVQSPA